MHAVKNFIQKAWNFVQLPNLYYHDEGYFMLCFKSHEDMDAILMKVPYTYKGIPILLKEWNPYFNHKKIFFEPCLFG